MEAKRGTKGMREKCGKNGKMSMKKKRKRGEEGGEVKYCVQCDKPEG